jgi:hypothetical protein
MAKLKMSGKVSLENLKENLSSKLDPKYNLILNNSRLEVVQDTLRGCVVKVEKENGETEILIGPFVPSTGLAVLMSLICVGIACLLMLFVDVILGVILSPFSVIVRLLPSSGLVNEVKNALEAS